MNTDPGSPAEPDTPEILEEISEMTSDNAVAFYGSLRPGAASHWLVRDIPGVWIDGIIRGYVFEITWGRYEGHVGFVPDPDGHRIPVSVLVSEQWPSHLHKVDEFEGPGYERRAVTVVAADGDAGDSGNNKLGEAAVYEFQTDRE